MLVVVWSPRWGSGCLCAEVEARRKPRKSSIGITTTGRVSVSFLAATVIPGPRCTQARIASGKSATTGRVFVIDPIHVSARHQHSPSHARDSKVRNQTDQTMLRQRTVAAKERLSNNGSAQLKSIRFMRIVYHGLACGVKDLRDSLHDWIQPDPSQLVITGCRIPCHAVIKPPIEQSCVIG